MKLLYNAESGPQAAHVTPCFVENYDVLVVGAGTAGAIAPSARRAAACACARWTGCPSLAACLPARYLAITMARRAGSTRKSTRAPAHFRKTPRRFSPARAFSASPGCQALEEMFAEEGVCTRYETFVLGVFVEGRRIAGVRCVSHGRVEDLSCAFAIDGTSEGYLCAMAGCAASLGALAMDARSRFPSFRSPARRGGGAPRGIPTAILAMWIPAAARRFPAPC